MILGDLPLSLYHSAVPQWLSKTSLRDYDRHGPAWWKLAYLDRAIRRETPDGADQGTALDLLLTQGHEAFVAGVAEKPADMSFSTKEGKAWRAAQAGKIILSAADMAIMHDAVAAVRACSAWPAIQQAHAQQTIRRQAQALGLGLQSRPDWLRVDGSRAILWDLKKTRSLDSFGRQAIDLGYHLQAAVAGWCLAGDGIALEHAYLVAVEWERGARCRVYEIPHEALADGDRRMRAIAAEIADRIKRGDWIDRQDGVQPLPIPEWVMRKMEAA